MDCLAYALSEFNLDSSTTIWYDGDHILCYRNKQFYDLKGPQTPSLNHVPIEEYGLEHVLASFQPAESSQKILRRYFNTNLWT